MVIKPETLRGVVYLVGFCLIAVGVMVGGPALLNTKFENWIAPETVDMILVGAGLIASGAILNFGTWFFDRN